jgi:membrane protease YdiL (CAAX protease family)
MVALEVAVTIVVEEFLGGSGAVAESGEAAGASDGARASELAAASRKWLVPLLGLRGLGSVVIVSGILLFRRQSVRSVGLARRSLPLDGIIGLGTCGVAYLAIILVTMLIINIFPEAVNQMLENAERLKGIVPKLTLGGFLGVAVVIGVYEELVFRGFLMTRLRRATQSWTAAVLISTAVFTALHAVDQTPVALVWITILSLIFSAVTIWRRSIVPAIVAHVLFDFTQFVGMALQSGESWT